MPRPQALLPLALSALCLCGEPAEANPSVTETWDGRELIVLAPDRMPAPGTLALAIVLHGGWAALTASLARKAACNPKAP